MKHASLWLQELSVDVGVRYSTKPQEEIIRNIQLDAMKEGMRRAVLYTRAMANDLELINERPVFLYLQDVTKNIECAAEQLTLKNL
jgi:hypothetical protein